VGNTLIGWGTTETNNDSKTKDVFYSVSTNSTSNATATIQGTSYTLISDTPTINAVSNNLTFSSWNSSNWGYYVDTNPAWPAWQNVSITIANVTLVNTSVSF